MISGVTDIALDIGNLISGYSRELRETFLSKSPHGAQGG